MATKSKDRLGICTEVGVDSGVIEFSFTDSLHYIHSLYRKIMDLTCWTADIVFDGEKGAIGTPLGDGLHTVVYMHASRETIARKALGKKTRLIPLRSAHRTKGAVFKGMPLLVGDCGEVHGRYDVVDHKFLGMGWKDDYTLFIVTW